MPQASLECSPQRSHRGRITFRTVSLCERHAVLKFATDFPRQRTNGPLSTDNIHQNEAKPSARN
ncbi:hypothetical protein [Xylella fastidiosa]|uniref:hypothetical protein n=1 Tax=Xylella fastidiosa TaxID=2371 RepID=UPI001378B017|nr:hypothetical protein [Xylella fastidiosa]